MTVSVFLIAIGAPFLWALVNHADKFLIDKFFGTKVGGGVGGLMIFSTLFSVFLLPIIIWMDPNIFDITVTGALILMSAGAINAISILLYLYALNEGEATVVVPFMQLIPVFSFIFGYYLLGETVTWMQVVGGMIIILGSGFLALGGIYKGQKLYFKTKIVVLMTLHSIGFGLYGILFKLISIKEGFWSGAFWEAIGLILTGCILFCIPSYRNDFLRIIRGNSKTIIGINLISELFTILGNWLTAFASLMSKVVLVTLIAGFQPVFVLVLGVLTTMFFPYIMEEDISRRALTQKIFAVVLIGIGTYLLY
ncbi:MAG: DMT family transporter [Minisyncoccia bacterium]